MAELTKEELNQPVTKGYLGEYTEGVLLPAIGNLIDEKLKPLENSIAALENKIEALEAKITTHLELSDKRYLELKRRDAVITKWIKQLADKTGVDIDLKELEKF